MPLELIPFDIKENHNTAEASLASSRNIEPEREEIAK
jgi:hypothetical protein